ncbi:ADP-ribose pyrophosphatase [Baekduia alba]|uniref:NUDIX domain-containing protein n=1 Tax=Baekduia alba TaxID=2997333 RepID=UPI0023420104|nr:NUDIX hydrolase [Baekduia alba]WCB93193.1 ADP-ribose pyrophosphatase [Baekduia alba]
MTENGPAHPRDPGQLRVTASRTVYENHWMRVREDETLLPDGRPGLYAVIEKPPAAAIVARDGDWVWLVQQWRHPVQARFWEVPQGAWHHAPDAAAEDVARGELAEETGLRAGRIERLARLYFAYGMSDQSFDVWLATDLTQGEQALEETEQGLVVGRHRVDDVAGMVTSGQIADSGSVAALGLAGLLRG